MLFLAVFASLAAAMAMVAQTNLRSADTSLNASRALAATETGVTFARYRLAEVASGFTTDKGEIDASLAQSIWAQVSAAFNAALAAKAHYDNGWIAVSSEPGSPRFRITLEQHPITGEDYGSAMYQRAPYSMDGGDNEFTADGLPVAGDNPIEPRWIRATIVGEDGGIQRTIRVNLKIDKKVRFAILSRNRVMIGRNVVIKGPIGSNYTYTDVKHGHPVQMRDNFHDLNSTLDGYLNDLSAYLGANDVDGDNRVSVADTRESGALADAASVDRNADGYIDSYDMFLLSYDANADGAISATEFSQSGALVDEQLWQLINEAKFPAGTKFDWASQRVKLPGGEWADATADMAVIDDDDQYAKLHGEVYFKSSKSAWEDGAAGGDYQKYFRGPVTPDAYEDAVTFDANASQIAAVDDSSFDVSTYRTQAAGNFASQTASPVPNDPDQPAVITPPGPGTLESVPFNAPYPYDYYARPVYENMTFTNVTTPKGTNALFVNCKFVGVTFIDTEVNNTDPNYNYAGMQDATGALKYFGVSANVNGTEVTDTKALGNNVRFHDCKFEGIVATESPQAFSHVRNKIQFTGKTEFDIEAPSLTVAQKQLFEKSTIMAPQYSIDVGTFTQPASSNETTTLDGTIVAGVLDIRGQAEINGSILTTFEPVPGEGVLVEGGSPANFNTTIGYFESSAGDSEAELPGDGYGKIIIRYDPYRPMPDGILGPIEIRADMDTYVEGQ